MEAHDHALKEFVGIAGCGGEKILIVGGDAADQTIRRLNGTDGPWIDVVKIDAFGDVDLPAFVYRFFGPRDFVQKGETFIGENEAALDVIILIEAGEFSNTDARRLEPIDISLAEARILKLVSDRDFIRRGPNLVLAVDE